MVFGLVSCQPKQEQQQIEQTLTVTQPIMVDTSVAVDYIASIQSKQNVEIRSKIKGYLDKIYVEEGSMVKSGQVLFKISSVEFQQEVKRSQALLKLAIADEKSAELELQNIQRLFAKGIVSKSELDKAKILVESANAKIEEAQAQLQSAEFHLSQTVIKAPFDGIINRIPFKMGSLIDDGTLLTTLSNNQEVFAYFHVSEKEYLSLKSNKDLNLDSKITLLLANNKPHLYKGKIENEDGEFDLSTGNIAFRVRFANPDLLIKHGSTGKIRIFTDLKDAMIVPQKSTFEIQDQVYVFVLDQNNVIRSKNIKIKHRLPHLFIVEKGLTTSDKIVFEGIQKVKDGDKIKPRLLPMSELILNQGDN